MLYILYELLFLLNYIMWKFGCKIVQIFNIYNIVSIRKYIILLYNNLFILFNGYLFEGKLDFVRIKKIYI